MYALLFYSKASSSIIDAKNTRRDKNATMNKFAYDYQ